MSHVVGRRVPTRVDERAGRGSSFYVIFLCVSFLCALLVLWIRELSRAPSLLLAPPTLGYPDYYRAQAEALIQGRLWVPVSSLGDECYFVDGKCFGYFGLTPSLLRLAPAALNVPGDFSPVSVLLGYAVGVIGALLLLLTTWRWLAPFCDLKDGLFERSIFVCLAAALGPGSASVFATRTDVADEAILWGCSATIWTTLFFILWLRHGSAAAVWAGVASAVLAAGARPSLIPAVIGLGIVGFVIALRHRPRNLGPLSGFLSMSILPAVFAAAVFYLKFGRLVPDMRDNHFIKSSPFWQAIRAANGDVLFSWIFIPQNAWNFLRPTGLHYELTYPRGIFFRQADSFWPAPPGGSYLEPAGSLTTFAPLLVGLSVCALLAIFWKGLRPSEYYGSLLAIAGALSVGVLATWSQVAMTNRYLVDAVPLLAFLSILGGVILASRTPSTVWLRVVVATILFLLTFVGLVTVVYVMR